MNKEFIPYQQALVLKELGFNEPCFATYQYPSNNLVRVDADSEGVKNSNFVNFIAAPLYQQVFRWFRDEYGFRGFIGFRPNVKQFDFHIYDMYLSGKEYVKQRTMEEFNKDPKFGTYEEAELACLIKLIEITKN